MRNSLALALRSAVAAGVSTGGNGSGGQRRVSRKINAGQRMKECVLQSGSLHASTVPGSQAEAGFCKHLDS